MKHRVYKYFIDFEKEEKWLNEMAAKGYHFIDFSFPGRYLFEKGEPGEYIYRLELLKNMPRHLESQAYIEFMEETGAEVLSTYFRWVWFRKKAADGPFDLYTDYVSKIKHYQRVTGFVGIMGLINLFLGVWNLGYGVLLTGPQGHYFNAYISPVSFIVSFLCFRACLSYYVKLKRLKKERQIRE